MNYAKNPHVKTYIYSLKTSFILRIEFILNQQELYIRPNLFSKLINKIGFKSLKIYANYAQPTG